MKSTILTSIQKLTQTASLLRILGGVLAGVLLLLPQGLQASPKLPFVYDPLTKKYFAGGISKYFLRENEKSVAAERIEIAIDGDSFAPYTGTIEFKQEGKHVLRFRASNPVNNWSPIQFVEVFVDLTAPTTTAKFTDQRWIQTETGPYVAQDSTLALSSQDNLSGIATIEYSFDGKAFEPYQKPIKLTKTGHQTLYYRSTDRVENQEVVKTLDFFVDGVPPNSSVKLTGQSQPTMINGQTFVGDTASFEIQSTDDGSKVKQIWVSVDGGQAAPYIKPIAFLKEGHHSLKYYAIDHVGNQETAKTLSVVTVSNPPQTVAIPGGKIVNTGGQNYSTRDFTLKLMAKDNLAGLARIEVKIDDSAEFTPYLDLIRFKTLGTHTINYRAVDRAGNQEAVKTYTVNIYETAPETKLTVAQPVTLKEGVTYSPAPNIVTLNVGPSAVGVKHTLVSINDGPFTSYQGPITLNANHKTYKIRYKSVDLLGNEESSKTEVYRIMTDLPLVDLFVTNGRSKEEQVRTKYLDLPGQSHQKHPQENPPTVVPSRGLASPKQ